MRFSSVVTLGVGLIASLFDAAQADKLPPPLSKFDLVVLPVSPNSTHENTKRAADPSITHYFQQLIDHSDPSKGTFPQRYYFADDLWGGPGHPIIIMTPGEQSADGWYTTLTGYSLMREMMTKFKAAGVVLEHRYYGESSPYSILSTDNLKYLDLDQSMEDIKHFVETVQLPSSVITNSDPNFNPWFHIGCSYPGLLAAYIAQKYPNLFAATWSSSAPVQADGDFWEYFAPIEAGMPKNCSSDVGAAISHIDSILDSDNPSDILAMKTLFGMQNTVHADFAQYLVLPLVSWQSMQAYTFAYEGYGEFYQFCDAIETDSTGKINKKKKGVGLPQAYYNYAKFFKSTYSDFYCPGGGCFTTFDYTSSTYTDWSVNNWNNRQWMWFVCTEFGWFQTGDPGNGSKIVSKYVTEAYNLRQCSHMFPLADGSLRDYYPDIYGNNDEHKGWNLKAPHLFVVNGQYDPWISASLSSKYGPKYRKSKDYQKVAVIKNGHHCWDWSSWNADLNKDVRKVVDQGMDQLKVWLKAWFIEHHYVDEPWDLNLPATVNPADLTNVNKTDPAFNSTNIPGDTGVKGIGGGGTPNGEADPFVANSTSSSVAVGEHDNGSKSSGVVASAPLVYTSLALNAALIAALIGFLVMFLIRRRNKQRRPASSSAPRGTYFPVEDKLGEYSPTLGGLKELKTGKKDTGYAAVVHHDDDKV